MLDYDLQKAFVPNEMRTSILTIISYDKRNIAGYLSNPFYPQHIAFTNLTQLLLLLDDLADQLGYPQRSNDKRTFSHKTPIFTADQQTNKITGQPLASFKISILFRQNASWQGSCEWVEKNKSANFRSALELVQLMDSVLINHIE